MAVLAVTYLRVDADLRVDLSVAQRRALERIRLTAVDIYGPQVDVDVTLALGTFWAKVMAIGSLLITLERAVEHYGSLRDGVSSLVQDARSFGDRVVTDVLRATGTNPQDIAWQQRRTGIAGQLAKLIGDLTEFALALPTLDEEEAIRRAEELERRFHRVIHTLNNDDRSIVRKALADERERLPSIPDEYWRTMPVLDEATRRRRRS